MENTTSHNYFPGAGEMVALTRNHDWASTPVGPIEQWPLSLKNTVSMILSSRFPMFLWWGDDHIQFYNDAYRPSLGDSGKHPKALGEKGKECWPEIWDTIYPLIQKVLRGEDSVWFEDHYLPIFRNGSMEDVYWTFSYSAVRNDNCEIAGVLVVCTETTEKVLKLKILEDSKNELEFAIEATELGIWDFNPKTGKFTGNSRLKSWFGLAADEHIPLSLAIDSIIPEDRKRVTEAIEKATQYGSGGYYDIEYSIKAADSAQVRIVKAKGRAWFDENNDAYRFNGTLQDITEQKRAVEEAARALQLTDIAVKSAGVGIFNVDLTTGGIEFSPAFAYILTGDHEKKAISRQAFMRYLHPDDLADRAAALKEGAKTNNYYYSPRVIWDDGSVHRIVVNGSDIYDAARNAISFSGTVRDITQLENQRIALEEAEVSRRRGETMFRNVANSSPTGLWLSDTKGGLIYVNHILQAWTGLTYDEFMKDGYLRCVIDEDKDLTERTFAEAILSESHFDLIFRLRKANGETIWCRAAGDPYYGEDGEFEGYAGYCMDIDEIISGRQALIESEEKFRSMIEEAPVGTCLFTGKEMKIEVANEIMLRYWDKDTSAVGKPLAEAVPELVGQPFLAILDTVFETGRAYEAKDAYAQLMSDGVLKDYYFDFTYKPLFDAYGKVYGIMDMAVDVTERVTAQQRIEESQKQVLDSFEQSPVGIALLRKEGLTFITANPFYCNLVGRQVTDIVGKPLLEALPEINGQGFDVLLEAVIDTGIPYIAKEVAVDLMRNNVLEKVYVDLTYQPRWESGVVTGVLVVATDVTQQVRSRQEVERSEAKLRSIIATAPAGIGLFTGRDLVIEMPNQTFIDIVGKGWDVVGKPLREAMPELVTHGQPFLKILDDVFTSGKMYQSFGDQVKIIQNGELTYNYYNITYSPVFDENGEVYAILDIAIDVTEMVLSRQKAENAEAALRGAVELAELATWRYNIQDNTFSYSQRFMEWLGFSEDTKNLDDAYNPLPDEYRDAVVSAIEAAIAPGSSGIYENEHPIINRVTGQVRIIHAQAHLSNDAAGNPEFLTGTAQDVTKERKLQQQLEYEVKLRTEELQRANSELASAISLLEQNNQELSQFAYIASHDLQEPARKISIFAKMLQERLTDMDERSQMYLNKINTSAERMGILVSDVLSFSQLSKEGQQFGRVDLNKIIADTQNDLELIIEQKNALVEHNELPVIEGIPMQLSQLFGNLVSNSLKYSRPGVPPKITVQAKRLTTDEAAAYPVDASVPHFRIIFRDNGIGFGQEYADRIFNIFQRLHGKTEYSGTGIGLAICKKIVLNHNGHIEASAKENSGAEFIVIIPEKHTNPE